MPSSGLSPVDREVAAYVADVAKMAFMHGLQVEWFEYFLGGLKSGLDPYEAAASAAIEWDF